MVSLATVGGKITANIYNQIANFITSPGFFKGTITTATAIPAGTNWGKATGPTFTTITDPLNGFSTATGLYTCKSAGEYIITAQIKVGSTGVSTPIQFSKNGAAAATSGNTAATSFAATSLIFPIRLALGDTVGMQTATAFTTQSDAPFENNYFFLQQVSL